MVPVDITDVTVVTVVRRLFGSAGPGGVVSISLQHWLMRFGVASLGFCNIVREFRDWMSQRSPTLGGLQVTDFRAPHWHQQVPWGKASRSGGDLASDVGKVPSGSDRGGGQQGLRNGVALRWPGGGY